MVFVYSSVYHRTRKELLRNPTVCAYTECGGKAVDVALVGNEPPRALVTSNWVPVCAGHANENGASVVPLDPTEEVE